MKSILSLLVALFSCVFVFGQDLHVYYDVAEGSVLYELNGQRIEKPRLRKGDQVVLHVRNFNDYIYTLDLKTTDKSQQIPASGVEQMFTAGKGQEVFDKLKAAASSFGITGFGMNGTLEDDRKNGPVVAEEESIVSAEVRSLQRRYQMVLEEMEEIEAELVEISEDIDLDVRSQQFNNFMKGEIKELKSNASLSPQVIKQMVMEYMEQILDVKKDKSFDFKKLVDRANTKNSIALKIEDFRSETDELNSRFNELTSIRNLLAAIQLSLSEEVVYSRSFEKARLRTEAYQTKIGTMEAQLPALQSWDIKELAAVRYQYEEMKSHDFSKTIILTPESDLTQIEISLVPLDSMRIKGASTQSLNPIRVPVYGGLKINASIGLSFASFFDRPQDYFVRNGQIIGDNLDPFTPIVTSFIHFYSEGKKQVTLGGTLGLGIGIGGEGSGLQNYMLGPSLIIGKGQRIVLSGGLMGGKVTRLAQGYSVGDAYDSEVLPKKSIYEMGYFLGVSFNILGQ